MWPVPPMMATRMLASRSDQTTQGSADVQGCSGNVLGQRRSEKGDGLGNVLRFSDAERHVAVFEKSLQGGVFVNAIAFHQLIDDSSGASPHLRPDGPGQHCVHSNAGRVLHRQSLREIE